MRVGDRIVAIDGTPLKGRTIEQVKDMLRGEPDTTVGVTFYRDGVTKAGSPPLEVTLQRRAIKLRDVKV